MNLKMVVTAALSMLIWVFSLYPAKQDGQNTIFSCESPFCQTPYKKALDCCMQIWGDVCVLRDNKEINAERNLLVEVVLGRMTYLDVSIAQLLSQETVIKPQPSDIDYLNKLISRLETACDQVISWDASEKVQCFKPLVKNIQNKLKK